MTLAEFKNRLKIGFVVFLVLFYGVSLYSLGKYGTRPDALKVKGATTEEFQREKVINPVPSEDIQSPQVLSKSIKLCSNTTKGFELAYPADWFTTYNEEEDKCQYFAPYSFVIPESKTGDFAPIQVEALNLEEWEPTVKFFENPNEFYNVISTQTIEINEKLVKKIEAQTTGAGVLPRGFTQMVYLIFDSKTPMQIRYQQLDSLEDVNLSKQILEDISRSVNYF